MAMAIIWVFLNIRVPPNHPVLNDLVLKPMVTVGSPVLGNPEKIVSGGGFCTLRRLKSTASFGVLD